MNTLKYDKVLGALYGFAIGDAMGATTEFMTASAIHAQYGQVDQIIGGGWLHLKAGEVTDDTQMTLCVADAIMDNWPNEDAVMQGICTNFENWLTTKPKDVGNTCYRSIVRNEGKPWKDWSWNNEFSQKSCKVQDLGNGGLMRCLVPCLMGQEELAVMQSRLTHANDICDYAIRQYYHALWTCLTRLAPSSTLPPLTKTTPTGHVENTLRNAIWWNRGWLTFRDTIIAAVNDGGDADTIAALAGGLAGARCGYTQIPSEWLSVLQMTERDHLKRVADFIVENAR